MFWSNPQDIRWPIFCREDYQWRISLDSPAARLSFLAISSNKISFWITCGQDSFRILDPDSQLDKSTLDTVTIPLQTLPCRTIWSAVISNGTLLATRIRTDEWFSNGTRGEDVTPWCCALGSSKQLQNYSRSLLITLCGMHGSEAVTAVSFEVTALWLDLEQWPDRDLKLRSRKVLSKLIVVGP